MCDVCQHNPCHPYCPNYDGMHVVGACEHCGQAIYSTDEFYTDETHTLFCSEDCAKDYYGIKETNADEWED